MPTLFELKQNMATIGEQVAKIDKELTEMAINPKATREDLQNLQAQKADMQARFDVIKAQHDEMEKVRAAKLADQPLANVTDPKVREVKAKAELFRATVRNSAISSDVLAVLGDNGATNGTGDKFLPKTVSNQIITEPLAKNPLRDIVTVTNITNLELPKLSFTLDDDAFIKDTATAKELEATGSTVTFTRKKFKVFAGISETVLNGSDANLVAHVENALRSGVAAKEKKVMFAANDALGSGEEHMSFYADVNAIAKVEGADTYNAIKNALADLHEDYRENAKIVMTYADYSAMIETLANGNTTLFNVQPEMIFGKQIVFTDAAISPIVGDFSYSHINYDLNVLYDRDKDVKTGIELFVITAWMDHRIKLSSAFRIAEVTEAP